MLKNKFLALRKRSFLFQIVAAWLIFVSCYNLYAWVVLGSFFSLLGLIMGAFILIGMWIDLDKKKKEYNRYYG